MIKILISALKLEHENDALIKQLTIWQWIGRVVPLSVLFFVILCYFSLPSSWNEWIMSFIATGFASITFIFWWWIIYSIKRMYIQYLLLTKEIKFITELIEVTQKMILERAENVESIHDFRERTEQETDQFKTD